MSNILDTFPPLVWPWPTINDIRTQASQDLLDAPKQSKKERARIEHNHALIEYNIEDALL